MITELGPKLKHKLNCRSNAASARNKHEKLINLISFDSDRLD